MKQVLLNYQTVSSAKMNYRKVMIIKPILDKPIQDLDVQYVDIKLKRYVNGKRKVRYN